jgi:hypothetical protein
MLLGITKRNLVLLGVIVVIGGIGGLFAVNRLAPKLPGQTELVPTNTTTSPASIANEAPLSGSLPYHVMSQSISFLYPSNLLLISKDRNGNPMYPKLFFSDDQAKLIPSMYDFASCASYSGVDCISVFAFSDPGSNQYRIPSEGAGAFDGTFYIYPDAIQDGPFLLNGAEVVRYYAIDTETPNASIPTRIQERLYVKDPYISGRTILLDYQENKKIGRMVPGNISKGAMIAGLFDLSKKQSFEAIASSFTITPTDTLHMATGSVPVLGVAFQYPAYWGAVQYSGSVPGKPETAATPDVSFQSALFSKGAGIPTALQFDIENSSTVGSITEGMRPRLFQYAGQSLDNICKQHAYVNTKAYDFVLSRCLSKATASGMNVALISGTYASTSVEAVLFPTTSNQWPGMTIYAESEDISVFSHEKAILDRIADSLSYLH